ncbi:polysaccharide deacetylase family protein [Streptomyces pluripotens]|uniref:Polysaccharide deacetylase family protein n=1 Tax=Streptomyces pluripotens TaxID=1355015 RepID=A0A221NT99_9ACTN|nr:polysaccharide deacetylase family protein [Streptomyces pluripotens]ARP68762.1 polysaccharide deacetylase family protein [Streptomyces pluripotens]ASN23018.1 polysaccharide deacetylase family protein [Streptomyces pluripotens]
MSVMTGRFWPAAAALLPAAVAAVHIGPAATWLPGVRRLLFPGLSGAGRSGHVALTFDDGPDPVSTPYFLDVLDRLGVRATFFVLGEEAVRHPALVRETHWRGHELAVHGWTHDRPWRPSPARDREEVARTAQALYDLTGRYPQWYRPPYGILTTGRWLAARRAGLRTVLWSAWGKDWRADATPASVGARIAMDLLDGGTVLLHDSDRHAAAGCWHAALGALPAIVGECRAAGLTVGPLSDHTPLGHRTTRPPSSRTVASPPAPSR